MSCKNAVKVLFGGALLFAFLSFSCSQFAFFCRLSGPVVLSKQCVLLSHLRSQNVQNIS